MDGFRIDYGAISRRLITSCAAVKSKVRSALPPGKLPSRRAAWGAVRSLGDRGGIVGCPRSAERGVRRVEVAYHELSDADTAVARRGAASSSTTVLVSRRESFNAAHQLRDPGLSDEENQRLFGKCANLHGHNYVLEVVVAGEIDQTTGYVLDLKQLSDVICRLIIQDVDHRNLNTDVPWLDGLIPTAENLAMAFWERVRSELPEGSLRSVRLWETDKNWAEVGDHV
jgi:6-pyruvoyltetrahydropterin/6-carboxytetrahydropterin synthase